MNAKARRNGRTIRRILKLDRQWRTEGKREGRTENEMCWRMGQAYRAGLGTEMEAARRRQARRMVTA